MIIDPLQTTLHPTKTPVLANAMPIESANIKIEHCKECEKGNQFPDI